MHNALLSCNWRTQFNVAVTHGRPQFTPNNADQHIAVGLEQYPLHCGIPVVNTVVIISDGLPGLIIRT